MFHHRLLSISILVVILAMATEVGIQQIEQGENVRISRDADSTHRIGSYEVSPDGNWVYFTVTNEGYIRTLADNGLTDVEPTQIFSREESRVFLFYSPDSQFLYTASGLNDNPRIYRWTLQDGTETELDINFGLTSQQRVNSISLSPDGQYLLYRVIVQRESAPTRFLLFALDASGGNPTRIAGGNLALGFSGDDYVITEANQVIYVSSSGLGSVSVTGDASVDLSGQSDMEISTFQVSADGNYVVFQYERDSLYSAPVDGSQLVALVQTEVGQQIDSFWIAPNSQNVQYYFSDASGGLPPIDSLYNVPILGGAARDLLPSVNARGLCGEGSHVAQSGERVVLTAVGENGARCRLYSVLTDGTGAVELTAGEDYNVYEFQYVPETNRVVYTASNSPQPEVSAQHEVFAVPADGGESVNLSAPLLPFGTGGFSVTFPKSVAVDENGEFVAFTAKVQRGGAINLYLKPLSNAYTVRINTSADDDSRDYYANRFYFRPGTDEPQLVYRVEEDIDVDQLYLGARQLPGTASSTPTPIIATPAATATPASPTSTSMPTSTPTPAISSTPEPIDAPTTPTATTPQPTSDAHNFYLPLVERP